jgi:hypothetical protein
MNSDETKQKVISFFEKIEKYYGSKTEITIGISNIKDDFDAELTTWNLSEFIIQKSAYRNKGNKFMMEGKGFYYEIDANSIIDLKQPGRNKFEFIEHYSETVFRITKIRFHYKY